MAGGALSGGIRREIIVYHNLAGKCKKKMYEWIKKLLTVSPSAMSSKSSSVPLSVANAAHYCKENRRKKAACPLYYLSIARAGGV